MIDTAQYNPKTVAIYSVGLLGGSIGAGLKKSGYDGKIIGLSSENGLKTATELGLIDDGYPYSELSKIVQQTDLLILCSPILTIVKTIEALGAMDLPPGLVITDIGSTKKVIIDAAQKHLPPRVRFIGGHPMAGSEKSGPAASDPRLFQNAVYALTPARDGDAQITDALAGFLQKFLGCRTILLDPAKHDTVVAAVSHLPHILASALVLCAYEQEKNIAGTLAFAASGFRDTTRIASARYDIWHDIFSTNKDAIIPLIDSYIRILNDMKKSLADDALKDDFENARQIRNFIFSNKNGGLPTALDNTVIQTKETGK
ncbi:MAG: prephenate dehydrogenase/arogenate dehydrogenase family protein [Chitinispirillales bacterium]|jgi:prephenate dehydrogenase|nr:prephenate dehydrogenase/arogenate dehydrogenase family protein [Chitinispirillales bacterium]